MVELVDTHALGACAFGREGSSPFIRTKSGPKSELAARCAVFSLVLRSKTQMFSGGRTELWAAAGCAFLDFTAIGGFWYNDSGHKLIRRTIFVGLYSRPVQVGFA